MIFKSQKFKVFLVKIRNFFIRFRYKSRNIIRIEFKDKKVSLIMPEKFEKPAKWTLRIIIFIGIVSSILTLLWFFSLILAVILVVLEQILEKAVFTFSTMYIHAIPDQEDYKKANWVGMSFSFIGQKAFGTGMLFNGDTDSAKRVFETVLSWNDFKGTDEKNNINISFILEDDGTYTTYIYPNIKKEPSDASYKSLVRKKKKLGRRQEKFYASVVFSQTFKLKDSNFEKFRNLFQEGQSFYFFAHRLKKKYKDIRPWLSFDFNVYLKEIPVPGTIFILKKHIKIKERKDLTIKDLEYDHGRLVMEK